jgi:hypothetical protein
MLNVFMRAKRFFSYLGCLTVAVWMQHCSKQSENDRAEPSPVPASANATPTTSTFPADDIPQPQTSARPIGNLKTGDAEDSGTTKTKGGGETLSEQNKRRPESTVGQDISLKKDSKRPMQVSRSKETEPKKSLPNSTAPTAGGDVDHWWSELMRNEKVALKFGEVPDGLSQSEIEGRLNCSRACKALESMEKAASEICKLTGESQSKCVQAKAKVRSAQDRVHKRCTCAQ